MIIEISNTLIYNESTPLKFIKYFTNDPQMEEIK